MAKAKEIVIDGVKYIPESQVPTMAVREDMPYVIARTYTSGVFAGYLSKRGDVKDGYLECTLVDARRIWYWTGAASLSQLAQSGTSDPGKCKFPETVSEVELFNVIELLKCTDTARESIENVPVWKQ